MPENVDGPFGRPEGEDFDGKSALDPTSAHDYLKLAADLVAMANTRGGCILIGTRGEPIPKGHGPLFDSARVDDKVNSLVEPRIGGIKSSMIGEDFVLLEVEKSQNPPHVFKQDGTYMNAQGKNAFVFRKSDVFARHSSKSERASRSDFDRWFEERRQHLFENVKMIFEAHPNARMQIADSGPAVPFRIDPDAPGAQPVYDLITTEPFRDVAQELAGGVKAWKSSRHLLSELQLYKAYRERNAITDPEIIELILRSCWQWHLHGYWWVTKIHPQRLIEVLKEVVASDSSPSSTEALHAASLLPRAQAKDVFERVSECKKKGPRHKAKRLTPVLGAHARKVASLLRVLHSEKKLIYEIGGARKDVPISAVTEQIFDELLTTLLSGAKSNRAAFRSAELVLYGNAVQSIQFSSEEPITADMTVPAPTPVEPANVPGDSDR